MEKNSQELLEELVARLAEVRGQLDVIQSKVDELMNLKTQDADEPGDIDIDHEDFLSDIAVEVPVPEQIAAEAEPAEPEPVETSGEPDLPEAAIEPDLPEPEPSEPVVANEPEEPADAENKDGLVKIEGGVISVCANEHAFIGKSCPHCGGKAVDYFTRIVGYLVPTSAYSKERKMEESQRYLYNLNDSLI